MSLSQNIKKFRRQKGLTQEQIASSLGVSPQSVSKWECSETYPDGSLLPKIADILSVSLDRLFDRQNVSMTELARMICSSIASTPEAERFDLIRDIGWQIEKGLFNSSTSTDTTDYSPDEIKNQRNSSYITTDNGFTHISNGKAPFFSAFVKPNNGFAESIGDGEAARKVFAALGSSDTMKALLYLMKQPSEAIFDEGYLSVNAEIDRNNIDNVLSDLQAIRVIYPVPTEIDGRCITLYEYSAPHLPIALMLMAQEVEYRGAYSLQISGSSAPLM